MCASHTPKDAYFARTSVRKPRWIVINGHEPTRPATVGGERQAIILEDQPILAGAGQQCQEVRNLGCTCAIWTEGTMKTCREKQ